MFTTKMVRLLAVVLSKDAASVTEELLHEGVMQFINISEVEGACVEGLKGVDTQVSPAEVTEIRRRIEGLLHPAGIFPDTPKDIDLNNRTPLDIVEERKRLDIIVAEQEKIRGRQRNIQQEILKLEDIKRQVEMYGMEFSDMSITSRHTFISMQIGKLPTEQIHALQEETNSIPSVLLTIGVEDAETHVLMIFMKRDSGRIEKILSRVGWTRVELPKEMSGLKKDISQDLAKKLHALSEEQDKLRREAEQLVVKEGDRLKNVWINVRVNELFNRIQSYFKCSSRAMVFSGWLPADKKDRLTREIKQATEGRCCLEWYDAEKDVDIKEGAPVQFRNPKALAPFQMLVSNFGIPEYGSIDPTPFVMPIYMIMFGLMFADVGQGAVLSVLGILGAIFFKGRKGPESLINLSSLIVWCGASSIIFGFLFGSFFGMSIFKPLWFDFHGIILGHSKGGSFINDLFDVLAITLFFGIAVIFTGLIFNWINLIRKRRWMELVLYKGGIICGWIYAGGIYVGRHMMQHQYKSMPDSGLLFMLVGLPALLLFLKEPLHFIKNRKGMNREPFTVFTPVRFVMEWLVELLEVFSGYLSNTLSFMRVAGLGIAHVSLMMSFFTLANMAGGRGVFPFLIIIFGNILVVCLEGLSAGIQALRLNYYEFFTKFFHGTGRLYSPVSLNSRDD